MTVTAFCIATLLTLSPLVTLQDKASKPAPTPQTDSICLELGGLESKAVLPLLESQFKGLATITDDGKNLHIQADHQTVQAIRQTLTKYKLGQQDPAKFMPAPSEALALRDGQRDRSLGELFEQYCNLTGVVGLMDSNTRRAVFSTLPNILGIEELASESAASLLQLSLFQAGFLLDAIPGDKGVTLRLQSQNQSIHPMLVDSNRVAAYASHHALCIQTVISLPNTDIRSTSNICRQLIQNPQHSRLIPLGSSSEMLIQGPGPWVAKVTQVLMISENARKAHHETIKSQRALAMEVVRLRHAAPKDVLYHLEKFFPSVNKDKPRITSSIDPRLNAILLRCSKADIKDVLDLIAHLDVKED